MSDTSLQDQTEIHNFVEQAYLNYSMYVICDRALPHISDGLKPVQRRIIYAMDQLNLPFSGKHKKSARTVGDVLGKFHPHGDSACYEAMVLMAQPFSYRYPLVDGQGNWGSSDDPKSFAAMRYTEAKLTKYSEVLLGELDKGTVEFKLNFDGTLKEPINLPAQAPNILLNGTTGIAVGMATDILPHNINEVLDCCIEVLEKNGIPESRIYEIIKGPDFPTACHIITKAADIEAIYKSGRGSIKTRAISHIENNEIVFTSLPFQTSGSRVIEQIAAQMVAKKVPFITDIRDESDHENPTRIVIVLRNAKTDSTAILSHLYATTDLEKSYRVNMNIIGLDNKPQVKSLSKIVNEWCEFRQTTVLRRLNFRLDKINARLHLLEGLLEAFLNIDEVIRIVREEDDPKKSLMEQLKLSDTQATFILETKLRQLAKLEELKITTEQNDLNKEKNGLVEQINNPAKLRSLIISELKAIRANFGQERRCDLIEANEALELKEEDSSQVEDVTVFISKNGWVKTGKGHGIDTTKVSFKTQDALMQTLEGKSNDILIVMGDSGRFYNIPVSELPNLKSNGEPISSKIQSQSGEKFTKCLLKSTSSKELIICSDSGYGFVIQQDELYTRNKSGKQIYNKSANDDAILISNHTNSSSSICIVISNKGRLLSFNSSEIPTLTKGKGNKLFSIPPENLKAGEKVQFCLSIDEKSDLELHAGKRKLKLTSETLLAYKGTRGKRGKQLPRGLSDVISVNEVKKT